MKYDNKQVMSMFCALTPAEHERLALLSEELGEAQQAIGKIMRHGYSTRNPVASTPWDNRGELEKELGDVSFAMRLMIDTGDVTEDGIEAFRQSKAKNIQPYLHHNTIPRDYLQGSVCPTCGLDHSNIPQD